MCVQMWRLTAAVTLALFAFQSTEAFNLLVVGNSRLSSEHSMEGMIQSMLEEHFNNTEDNTATRFEVDGAKMADYAASSDLTALIDGRDWTWIVLQEYNMIPAFAGATPAKNHASYNESLKAILSLQEQIEEHNAATTTVLLDSWAYFYGDIKNPEHFPDYPTMQAKLSHGYNQYYQHILQKHRPAKVEIAPAGDAFFKIYDKSEEPLEPGSLFDDLYLSAAKHNKARKYPSLAGAYLSACVLFQTLIGVDKTGVDVRSSTYIPEGLDPEVTGEIQQVAYETVVHFESKGLPSQSESEGEEDDSSPDTTSLRGATNSTNGTVPVDPNKDDTKTADSAATAMTWVTWLFIAITSGIAFFFWRQEKLDRSMTQPLCCVNSLYDMINPVSPEESLARELGMVWSTDNRRSGRMSFGPDLSINLNATKKANDRDDSEEGQFVGAYGGGGLPHKDQEPPVLVSVNELVDCWEDAQVKKKENKYEATLQAALADMERAFGPPKEMFDSKADKSTLQEMERAFGDKKANPNEGEFVVDTNVCIVNLDEPANTASDAATSSLQAALKKEKEATERERIMEQATKPKEPEETPEAKAQREKAEAEAAEKARIEKEKAAEKARTEKELAEKKKKAEETAKAAKAQRDKAKAQAAKRAEEERVAQEATKKVKAARIAANEAAAKAEAARIATLAEEKAAREAERVAAEAKKEAENHIQATSEKTASNADEKDLSQ